MKLKTIIFSSALITSMYAAGLHSEELKVNITQDLASVDVKHNGQPVTIQRNQHATNTVNPAFAKTSRRCPPFCVVPIKLAPGVETLGELELIDYISQMSNGDESIMVIDSRTPAWTQKGTIPGAVNVPWTELSLENGATLASIAKIVTSQFNAEKVSGGYDYSNAKTLVLFCNGIWCGQSPNNIRLLLKMGYPAEKIKWYRGGMQNWENLGFNTVK